MNIAAIASCLNLLGLIVFGYWVKGLRQRIENLHLLAREQKETVEVVRMRATELDQLRKDYRQGLDDFKDLGEKMNEIRAEIVKDLERAVKSKDEQLARTKQRELDSLDRFPELEKLLAKTIEELQRQISFLVFVTSPESSRMVFGEPRPTLAEIIRGEAAKTH
jgi:DNA repair exonuclease SbcCD ATPase subunit